jgi:hypothetical protein
MYNRLNYKLVTPINQKKVAKKASFISKLSLKSYICENLIRQNDDWKRNKKRRKIQIL